MKKTFMSGKVRKNEIPMDRLDEFQVREMAGQLDLADLEVDAEKAAGPVRFQGPNAAAFARKTNAVGNKRPDKKLRPTVRPKSMQQPKPNRLRKHSVMLRLELRLKHRPARTLKRSRKLQLKRRLHKSLRTARLLIRWHKPCLPLRLAWTNSTRQPRHR